MHISKWIYGLIEKHLFEKYVFKTNILKAWVRFNFITINLTQRWANMALKYGWQMNWYVVKNYALLNTNRKPEQFSSFT